MGSRECTFVLVAQEPCVSKQASSHLFANSSCVAPFSMVVEAAGCPDAKRPRDVQCPSSLL